MSFGHGNGMRTTIAGRRAASSCAASSSSRTPCMLTRQNSCVTVVSAPTISSSPERRTSCSAQALSLPLDQAISALVISCLARRECTERPGLPCPARRMRAFDCLLDLGAEQTREPVDRERRHGGLALPGKVGPEIAGDFDETKARAGDVGEQSGAARTRCFLEYEVVALQSERVAGKLDCDVIV